MKTAANSHVYRPHSISLQSSTGGRHIISFGMCLMLVTVIFNHCNRI